jgi:hypothetical protein
MRPLRVGLDAALERLPDNSDAVPTRPVPRIVSGANGSGEQWVESELDAASLVRAAMAHLQNSGHLRAAELVLARELGLDDTPTPSGWSPQRTIIEGFLSSYLLAAAGAPDLSPLDDPSDIAFAEETERLHAFLTTPKLTGQLLVPIGGVTLPLERMALAPDVAIVTFTAEWRDELWRIGGWGSTQTQPLQSHEFHDISHAIEIQLDGEALGGWDWAAAQKRAGRARLALLLAGASAVRESVSWLRHDERFATYLAALQVGHGIVSRPLNSSFAARTRLTEAQAEQMPSLYTALGDLPEDRRIAMALRRLRASSERTSAEDRLIDMWIAFEALFAKDSKSELRYRASLRIARYVGRETSERRDIFAGLKLAYDWRSRLVHGGDPAKIETKNMGTIDEAVALCEEVLRGALSKAVLAGTAPQLEQIDDTFLA